MATREQMLSMGLNAMTEEQKFEARSKGGKIAQAKARRRKNMQEIAAQVLSMNLEGADEIRHALKVGGMVDADLNYAAGIVMVQTQKAMHGDTKAAEFVRDTSGQKPVDGLMIGNYDDRPFETINLTELTEDQLKLLIQAKFNEEE